MNEPPLFIWKFLLRDSFVAVATAASEHDARARLLAYGIAEIDDDEDERVTELKQLLELCDVIRLPANMPGIVCWAKL